jgi:hypothetical protein
MGRRGTAYLHVLFVMLFACGAGGAENLRDVPTTHKFWDTANKTLFLTHAVLEVVDFGITHHNLSNGGREMDPMAKALCESGTSGQFVFFGMRMAGVVAISYVLHRTGHHTLERAFPVYASGVWSGLQFCASVEWSVMEE